MTSPHIDNERLRAFAAKTVSPVGAWPIRHHLRRCVECRDELERLSGLWDALAQTRGERPPETVWTTIAQQIGAAPGGARIAPKQPSTITIGGYTMSKASAAIAAIAAVTIISGAVAARLTHGFDFRANMGFSDHQRRQWSVRTSSDVKIEMDDSDGVMFAQGGNENKSGADSEPIVDIRVGAVAASVRGLGRHEIRDNDGRLLGVVVLSDWSGKEREQRAAEAQASIPPHEYDKFVDWAVQREKDAGGVGGTSGMGPMAWGHDSASNLFWCARGLGSVKIAEIGASSDLTPMPPQAAAIYPALKFADTELAAPRLTVMVHGDRVDYHGYGIFPVKVAEGKTLTFTIEQPKTIAKPKTGK